jgi:hypothetical protein
MCTVHLIVQREYCTVVQHLIYIYVLYVILDILFMLDNTGTDKLIIYTYYMYWLYIVHLYIYIYIYNLKGRNTVVCLRQEIVMICMHMHIRYIEF